TYISKTPGLPNGVWLPVMRGMEHYSPGPNLIKYLSEYREVLKEYDAFQVGEAPMMTPKNALKYTAGENKVLDMMFGFQHMEADCVMISYAYHKFSLKKLKKVYNNWQTTLYHKGWNTNYLENHDQPRNVSRYGSEKYRFESGKALCTMYTFLSGTQFVYQGQEIGMSNLHFDKWEDFVDVSTFSTKSIMEKLHIPKKWQFKMAQYAARDNARTPVQWSAEKNAGFTTGDTTWYTVNSNYTDVNVASQLDDPASQLNYYRKAIALRKEYKDAAVYGSFKMYLPKNKNLFVYDKVSEDGKLKLTVVLNMSDKAISSKKVKKYIPANAVEILSNYDGGMTETLLPYEAHVYKTV
ncbi:MAG: alpha-amylase family glycosyl hydrolase, partial [Clostridia bacterium]|nr:alpha-amylase family glycosyl hydrolase [Clostridia bacterium]